MLAELGTFSLQGYAEQMGQFICPKNLYEAFIWYKTLAKCSNAN